MNSLFSPAKLNTTLFLFIPVLLIISWINMNIYQISIRIIWPMIYGVFDYSGYLFYYILPSTLISFILSLIIGEKLAKIFSFTFTRILFTFLISLMIIYFSMNFFIRAFHINKSIFISFITNQPFIWSEEGGLANRCPPSLDEGSFCHPPAYLPESLAHPVYISYSIILLLVSYKISSSLLKSGSKTKKRK